MYTPSNRHFFEIREGQVRNPHMLFLNCTVKWIFKIDKFNLTFNLENYCVSKKAPLYEYRILRGKRHIIDD